MPSETSIHQSIQRAIKGRWGHNAHVIKIHGNAYTGPGHPDLVGSIHGRAFAMEVKRPGEEPEPAQVNEGKKWRRSGAITGVVRSAAEAMALLESEL